MGPDIEELRAAFDDLLRDSAANDSAPNHTAANDTVANDTAANDTVASGTAHVEYADQSVRDDQVQALDSAHELLARALTSLDTPR